jgi:hypothetical protein
MIKLDKKSNCWITAADEFLEHLILDSEVSYQSKMNTTVLNEKDNIAFVNRKFTVTEMKTNIYTLSIISKYYNGTIHRSYSALLLFCAHLKNKKTTFDLIDGKDIYSICANGISYFESLLSLNKN